MTDMVIHMVQDRLPRVKSEFEFKRADPHNQETQLTVVLTKNVILCAIYLCVVLFCRCWLHHLAFASERLQLVVQERLAALVNIDLRVVARAIELTLQPILRLFVIIGGFSFFVKVQVVVVQVIVLELHLLRGQF